MEHILLKRLRFRTNQTSMVQVTSTTTTPTRSALVYSTQPTLAATLVAAFWISSQRADCDCEDSVVLLFLSGH